MSPCTHMWEFSLEFIPRSRIFRSQMCVPSFRLEKNPLFQLIVSVYPLTISGLDLSSIQILKCFLLLNFRNISDLMDLECSQCIQCVGHLPLCYWVFPLSYLRRRASQVVQQQRIHLPMQEMQVQSLGWEDPLQKEMATHSSILVLEVP